MAPGATVWLGLKITHQPEWHTYWKNAGDSGLPTEFRWTLPAGLVAGDIDWPTPHKIPIGNLANYGYENTVLLPVPVTVASTFAPGPLAQDVTIRLRASWLVCRKECIPEEGEFALALPIKSTTAMHGAAFAAAAQAQPRPLLANTQGVVPDSQARITDDNALQISVHGLPKDCLVATDKELDRLLIAGGAKISPSTASKLSAVAQHPGTWANAPYRPPGDYRWYSNGQTAADKRTTRR